MIGMTAEQYRQAQADAMSEAQLQAAIIGTGPRAPGLAQRLGWLAYHTYRSDRSPAGFPDLTLVHPAAGLLRFAELKKQKRSNPTPAQAEWLEALALVERRADHDRSWSEVSDGLPNDPLIEVYLWRPLDLLNGNVERALRVSQ